MSATNQRASARLTALVGATCTTCRAYPATSSRKKVDRRGIARTMHLCDSCRLKLTPPLWSARRQ